MTLQEAVASGRPFMSKSWRERNQEAPWVKANFQYRQFEFVNGGNTWFPSPEDFAKNNFVLMPESAEDIIRELASLSGLQYDPNGFERINSLIKKAEKFLNEIPF